MNYIVQKGDSLYKIATKYNVNVNDIIKENNLTTNVLQIGQVLKIPTEEVPEVYVVQKGDSLYKIANKYNISTTTIINLNHLDNNVLQIGQKLKLKETFETPIHIGEDICAILEKVEDTKTEEKKYETYTVKKGDNLYQIAAKFNTDVGQIKYINNLENNVLQIGQVLKIPKISTTDKVTYVVQKGDTLYKIASKYKISVDELKQANKLSSNALSINQTLVIPTISYPVAKENEYIVQKGDSLYKIANKYNTTVNELIQKNNLKNTVLSIGQVLKI